MRSATHEQLDAAENIIQHLGDAICDVLDQLMKGNWTDDYGHPVANNTAMQDLGKALAAATAYKAAQEA